MNSNLLLAVKLPSDDSGRVAAAPSAEISVSGSPAAPPPAPPAEVCSASEFPVVLALDGLPAQVVAVEGT